jgi:CPA1 family monovalent cation:H+ antiporter
VNEQIIQIEEAVILLLALAVLVGIAARSLRVPYTIGLVLLGLALATRKELNFEITPNLILALLVPPLIFEAAFHLDLGALRRNLTQVLVLAVPGVIITTLLVGLVVAWGTGLPLSLAFVFGALVSATDPVSVVALFRSLGVPKRLQTLLEGESLLNDGTAIVIFNLVLALSLAGTLSSNLPASAGLAGQAPAAGVNWAAALPFLQSAWDFVRVSGGGLLIGFLLGSLISFLIGRIDDYLLETTLTSVLAYSAYLLAELVGVSGVLAVVAAGLINGNAGNKGMSPTTRIVVGNFWEYAAFLANTFVFLLIGLKIDLGMLLQNWLPILWAILSVLAARAATIYGLAWISKDIPLKWQHVLYWGGMRGAISLALALSLPIQLGPARGLLQSMAFGVVLFTLIVQGSSMGKLIKVLKLVEFSENRREYQRRHARAVASRTAREHLERLNRQGLLSDHTWHNLSPILKAYNLAQIDAVKEVLTRDPGVESEELSATRREYLRSNRSTYATLLKNGLIGEEVYTELVSEVDAALAEKTILWPEFTMDYNSRGKTINRLMTAVVQEQDVESAVSALTKLGVSVTRLPSIGGFLGRRNTTLMIGLNDGLIEAVMQSLRKSCRRRIEYVATPIEGSPLPFPSPTPVSVGGATVFTFELEKYVEF